VAFASVAFCRLAGAAADPEGETEDASVESRPAEPPAPPPLPERAAQIEGHSTIDWELGGVVSYLTPPIRGGTTPFGVGFGGRFGLVASNVYVGIKVVDYLGGTDVDLTDSALLAGFEAGYSIRLASFDRGYFALRPELGLGDAMVSHSDPSLAKVDVVTSASGRSSTSTTSDTITVHALYVAPALRAMLASAGGFASVSGSALVVPRISYGSASEPATWLCYGFQAEIGFRF
jgi:hypothetical protein